MVTSCSNSSTAAAAAAAAAETAEFRAKLSACDEIHEQVVGEYETLKNGSCSIYIVGNTTNRRVEPKIIDMDDGPGATEEYVDERGCDKHHCRNCGVGGGCLLRLLKSKVGGNVVRRPTYFTHDQQVKHEN